MAKMGQDGLRWSQNVVVEALVSVLGALLLATENVVLQYSWGRPVGFLGSSVETRSRFGISPDS